LESQIKRCLSHVAAAASSVTGDELGAASSTSSITSSIAACEMNAVAELVDRTAAIRASSSAAAATVAAAATGDPRTENDQPSLDLTPFCVLDRPTAERLGFALSGQAVQLLLLDSAAVSSTEPSTGMSALLAGWERGRVSHSANTSQVGGVLAAVFNTLLHTTSGIFDRRAPGREVHQRPHFVPSTAFLTALARAPSVRELMLIHSPHNTRQPYKLVSEVISEQDGAPAAERFANGLLELVLPAASAGAAAGTAAASAAAAAAAAASAVSASAPMLGSPLSAPAAAGALSALQFFNRVPVYALRTSSPVLSALSTALFPYSQAELLVLFGLLQRNRSVKTLILSEITNGLVVDDTSGTLDRRSAQAPCAHSCWCLGAARSFSSFLSDLFAMLLLCCAAFGFDVRCHSCFAICCAYSKLRVGFSLRRARLLPER
jgi:hypothetical protein